MNKKKLLTIMFALGLASSAAFAEDENAIQTDRPDFVESSNVVGKGFFQIETSVAFESDKNSDSKSRTFSTPTLLRLGVSDSLEIRFETDGRLNSRVEDRATGLTDRESGYADYSLGLKWHQTDGDEKTGAPSIGWLVHADMPSGSNAFRSHKIRPSLRMVAEWELADDYSFGVMPGVIYDVNDQGDRFWGGILGVVLGKAFTDKFRGFIEFGGQEIMRKKDGGSQLTFDTGFAYLVTDYVQLDLVYNGGLNRYTPDHTLGLGLSMKF